MYGLKPVPFKEWCFSAACKARTLQGIEFFRSLFRPGGMLSIGSARTPPQSGFQVQRRTLTDLRSLARKWADFFSILFERYFPATFFHVASLL
jgi:hypothetical protein